MNKFIESILNKDYMSAEKEFHKEISERVNDTVENIKQEISESLLESAGSAKQSYKVYYKDPETDKEHTTVLKANSHSHAKKLAHKFAGADVEITDSKQLNEQEALEEAKKYKMEEDDCNSNGMSDDKEKLNEISKKTLGSYVKKADHQVYRAGRMAALANRDRDDKGKQEADDWLAKRKMGISKAVDKLTKE